MVVYTIILSVISSLVGTIDVNLGGGGEGVRPAGVSFLFNILVAPPLWAGLYVGAFKGLNSQSLELGDFLKGFQFFAPLVLAQLIINILS